ncbi:hypothetical protein ACIRRA_44380 [Nocardia sp. NPDC101769]|uniref:hypothetical protein n=1 Tax=Nocardia sp. NPDC101769 TaxID=3364333 RepID=UPI003822FE83
MALRAEADGEWLANPSLARSRQLSLIVSGPGMPQRLAAAQRLRKPSLRKASQTRDRAKWCQPRREPTERDDPRICPPAPPGQLTLFSPRRDLRLAMARRILHRLPEGYDKALPLVHAYAAERRYSRPWKSQCQMMIQLALAVRDADGRDLVAVESLEDLQYYSRQVREILQHAGLLDVSPAHARPLAGSAPARRLTPVGRSCADCLTWFPAATAVYCRGCLKWRRTKIHIVGACGRCGRGPLPLSDDGHSRCRACTAHVAAFGERHDGEATIQLWLGVLPRGAAQPNHQAPEEISSAPHDTRSISEHLVDPDQVELFPVRRDWSAVAHWPVEQMPGLTPAAQLLADELAARAREQSWSTYPARKAIHTLSTVLGWTGADVPVHESDIVALMTADSARYSARRACQFLESRGLLVPDPELRRDVHEQAITAMLERLPQGFATELAVWVEVERGHGHRSRRRKRSFCSIRRYLSEIMPVLREWAERVESLKQITTDDVKAAIAARKGNAARSIHIELRNVFRALRHERVIFRDPTRGLTFPAISTVPAVVGSDRLRGLIDHTDGAFARLVIALVAVHALPTCDLRRLLLDDLDLARGRLIVRRPGRVHTVWLDTLTHQLAGQWLAERHRRWPASTNPHLLINQQTAFHTQHPPIGVSMPQRVFATHGLAVGQVRQDRILDEAHHSADPLHLMRLFGISDSTAMRYVTAAHPERTSALPR